MANIREKIEKLLALAQSPNENEARSALLKAKELMAKNKLSEADFEDASSKELVHVTCPNIKWTTDSGKIWMAKLCKVIADNYCCAVAWSTVRGTRTHTLVITGIGDDVELCKQVINYATGFIDNQIKVLNRRNGNKSAGHSYAQGFILGLELAFEQQKEEHQEWGLVMVKPQEVNDYEKSLGQKNVRTKKTDFDPLAYLKGQNDGMEFDAKRYIGQAAN